MESTGKIVYGIILSNVIKICGRNPHFATSQKKKYLKSDMIACLGKGSHLM